MQSRPTPGTEPPEFKPPRKSFTVLASVTVAIGGLLFGYDTAVIAGAILFVREHFQLSPGQTELAVSVALAGAFAGAAVAGYLGDRLGRKAVLTYTAVFYGVFALGTGMANNFIIFLLARFLIGTAVGASSLLTPLYIAELAPVAIRGALVTLNQLAITIGVVAAFYVDFHFAAAGNWRWMFMSAVGPAVLLLIGLGFLPETPRWLATRERFDEAWKVLERIETPEEAERNMRELREVMRTDQLKFRELFAKRFSKPLIAGIGLAVFQQVTGINAIIYYAPTIFQMAGFQNASSAILATFGVGLVALATTVLALVLLDRVGRRPLLLMSIAGMTVVLLHLGLLIGSAHPSRVAVIVDIMAYVFAFDIGLGPVFWLLISEIYPTTARGQAMSLATVAIWGSDFVVAQTFLTMVGYVGLRGSFFVYAALCLVAFAFSYYMIPETKGRTLEEIESSWISKAGQSEDS